MVFFTLSGGLLEYLVWLATVGTRRRIVHHRQNHRYK
jgi:hypothetical protein